MMNSFFGPIQFEAMKDLIPEYQKCHMVEIHWPDIYIKDTPDTCTLLSVPRGTLKQNMCSFKNGQNSHINS